MYSDEDFRQFIKDRLTAASEDIFRVFQTIAAEYQKEIGRQHKLLDTVLRPEVRLRRTELPQQHVCEEEEIVTDQERESSPDEDDSDSPQTEEEQKDLCTHLSHDHILQPQIRLHRIEIPQQYVCKEKEIQTDPELSNQEQESSPYQDHPASLKIEDEQEESCTSMDQDDPDPPQIKNDQKELCNSLNQGKGLRPEIRLQRIELPQQHVCKEEEILTDKERESSLDEDNPDSPEIKKEEEELCTRMEEDQPVLKQETQPFMLRVTCDERNSNEDQTPDLSTDETQFTEAAQGKYTGKQPFKCDMCGQYFQYKYKLKMHFSQSHKDEKPYKCDLCDKEYNYADALTKHRRIHTGEKPFKCYICGEEFRLSETLRSHMRFHPGMNPYACHICGTRFAYLFTLKQHMKMHRGQTQTFPLTSTSEQRDNNEDQTLNVSAVGTQSTEVEQGKATELQQQHVCKNKEILIGQELSNQGGEYSLDQDSPQNKKEEEELCTRMEGDQLATKQETETFMLMVTCEERKSKEDQALDFCPDESQCTAAEQGKPTGKQRFKCDICGKYFQYKCKLRRHSKIHTDEKPYKCNFCGREYRFGDALTKHRRIHTGEKPFKCYICGVEYRLSTSLKSHMKSHPGAKLYACHICGAKFTYLLTLKKHMKHMHTVETQTFTLTSTCEQRGAASGHQC